MDVGARAGVDADADEDIYTWVCFFIILVSNGKIENS